jgi:hypothetical protein
MIDVQRIDIRDKAQVRRFLDLPFSLYRDHPLWVPPIRMDAALQLNPDKHPFYEHSDAEFYIAVQDGHDSGRIAILENRLYNEYHEKRWAHFYLYECVPEIEVAQALFDRAQEVARKRKLTHLVGPKGFSALDGYGMLIEGYEFRPAMTMMNYNPPYYPETLERLGFVKEVDFVSCYLSASKFRLDERVHRIAARAAERSGLRVVRFRNKRELIRWVPKIGQTYNQAFVQNWEYHPLTDNEIDFILENVMTIAVPRLIKIIAHEEAVVGFLFAFPDVSAAIQRSKGRIFPVGIFDLLLEMRRTEWVILNGAGVLPEFHGRGGNALLYSEMEKTIKGANFRHADLTQIAESAVQMRRDLENVGGVPYKNHRVYIKEVE